MSVDEQRSTRKKQRFGATVLQMLDHGDTRSRKTPDRQQETHSSTTHHLSHISTRGRQPPGLDVMPSPFPYSCHARNPPSGKSQLSEK